MIGFGELRRKSLEWQMELSAVEKIYTRDWLLRGIFRNEVLCQRLCLRGASALASAYFSEYPRVQDIDLALTTAVDAETLGRELERAVMDAAHASSLQFRMTKFKPYRAWVEYTGPLGRRSAAQPFIVTGFVSLTPRADISERALIHAFGDSCAVTVRAISLHELAAERIVSYASRPRARDVFDLWFILTRGELDPDQVRALALKIAQEKKVTLRTETNPEYAPSLERGWENALKEFKHPNFRQARSEIETQLASFL